MDKFMKAAIEEAQNGIRQGHGGPFGCVIVKDGIIVGRGHNEVVKQKDPTCHGEVMAIRDACKNLNSYDLSGCELYTTAEPCPMCRGAVQWANIAKTYYGCNRYDTDKLGFRDAVFYDGAGFAAEELDREHCLAVFDEYTAIRGKKRY